MPYGNKIYTLSDGKEVIIDEESEFLAYDPATGYADPLTPEQQSEFSKRLTLPAEQRAELLAEAKTEAKAEQRAELLAEAKSAVAEFLMPMLFTMFALAISSIMLVISRQLAEIVKELKK